MVIEWLLLTVPAMILMSIVKNDQEMMQIPQWIRTPATLVAFIGLVATGTTI